MCASQALPQGAQKSPGVSKGTGRSTGRRAGQCEARSRLSLARGQAGGRWELSPWQSLLKTRRGGEEEFGSSAPQLGPPTSAPPLNSGRLLAWVTVAALRHREPGCYPYEVPSAEGKMAQGQVGAERSNGPLQGNARHPAQPGGRAVLVAPARRRAKPQRGNPGVGQGGGGVRQVISKLAIAGAWVVEHLS